MRLKVVLTLSLAIALCCPTAGIFADVDVTVKSEIKLGFAVSDMKLSRDGSWLYLLTREGQLLIYSYQGKLVGEESVGADFTQIEPGPTEAELYLLDKSGQRLRIAELTYPQEIGIDGSPFKGAADAPVIIVEYTDFQCPYCAKIGDTFKALLELYPGKIKIVYKSYPLSSHKYSWKAAAAAVAAHEKGQFWPFHDRLFEHFDKLDDAMLMKIRKEFGFDTPEFDKLMKSSKVRVKVADDKKEGKTVGVTGTPTVFVNGKKLKNKSLDGFKTAIEKELQSLKGDG